MTARRLHSLRTAPRRTLGRIGIAVLAGLLVAGLAGCGSAGRPGTAAVVGSRVITTEELATVTAEIGRLTPPGAAGPDEAVVLQFLVLAPFTSAYAAETGVWVPDNQYNSYVSRLGNHSKATEEAFAANFAFAALSPTDLAAVLDRMKATEIRIDPRYGTLDYTTGLFTPVTPAWIKPAPTAPATAPGS